MVCATVASVMRHEALELKFVWLLYQLVQHFQYSRVLQFWHQYTQYFGEGKSSVFIKCELLSKYFILWESIKTLSDTGIKTSCLHSELRDWDTCPKTVAAFALGKAKLLMYVEVNFEVLFPIGHDLEKYSSSSPPRPHLKRGGFLVPARHHTTTICYNPISIPGDLYYEYLLHNKTEFKLNFQFIFLWGVVIKKSDNFVKLDSWENSLLKHKYFAFYSGYLHTLIVVQKLQLFECSILVVS